MPGTLEAKDNFKGTDTDGQGVSEVVIAGPTVVAVFAPSQRAVDVDPGLREVLADFQFHLNGARWKLDVLGVKLIEVYGDAVEIVNGSGRDRFSPSAHGEAVGYYLTLPGGRPTLIYGVVTDDDLASAAREHFQLQPRLGR